MDHFEYNRLQLNAKEHFLCFDQLLFFVSPPAPSPVAGAEGYTAPTSPEQDDEPSSLEEPDTAELRRRRLQKLELPSSSSSSH